MVCGMTHDAEYNRLLRTDPEAVDAKIDQDRERLLRAGVLVRDALLPLPVVGDLLAIPASGAYHLSMASNYNLSLRPAVVVVAGGSARLVRRRETYEDLLRPEI